MPITEEIVHSLSEYVEAITKQKSIHQKLWFRGHASSSYLLMPAIYRKPYDWTKEQPLLHQFKARGARFISTIPANNYEWLFIMQHHSTPTRLLDWSENALVALAFAVQYRKPSHKGKDSNVWCLDPIVLNKHVQFTAYTDEPIPNICENTELQTMYEGSRRDHPIAIIGPQNSERIIAQRGVFTLFPNKDSFAMETLNTAETFLHKIIIPEADTKSISESLYYIGITESTLFPELDSVSKELRMNYERLL